jgi:hypothetical protein
MHDIIIYNGAPAGPITILISYSNAHYLAATLTSVLAAFYMLM